MHLPTSVITAIHVLLHGTLGCCGDFSAHAGGSAYGFGCTEIHSDVVVTHHHDSPEDPCHGPEHSPDRPHECPHDSCQWLNAKTVCADELFHADWNQPTLFNATPSKAIASVAASHSLQIDPPDRFAARSMRLHLAIGVLLI